MRVCSLLLLVHADSVISASILDKSSARANARKSQTSWKSDEEFGNFASRKPRLNAGPYSRPTAASGTPLVITRGRNSEINISSTLLGEGQTSPSEIVIEYDTGENLQDTRRPPRDAPRGSRSQQPRSAGDRKPKRGMAGRQPRRGNARSTESTEVGAEKAEVEEVIPRPITATFEATNLSDLFGTPSPIPNMPATSQLVVDKAQAKTHRIQVQMEHNGGDYSRLLPAAIIANQSNPINLAKATMGRRRDLGHRPRTRALNIVEGMIGVQAKGAVA